MQLSLQRQKNRFNFHQRSLIYITCILLREKLETTVVQQTLRAISISNVKKKAD